MAGRTVGTHVSILDEEAGRHYHYKPGDKEDEIPDKHLAKMTNPKVWALPIDIGLSNVPFDSAPANYNDLTVPQLLELLKQRNLTAESQRKADLINVLVEDDITRP